MDNVDQQLDVRRGNGSNELYRGSGRKKKKKQTNDDDFVVSDNKPHGQNKNKINSMNMYLVKLRYRMGWRDFFSHTKAVIFFGLLWLSKSDNTDYLTTWNQKWVSMSAKETVVRVCVFVCV